jgi:hypothetical protein
VRQFAPAVIVTALMLAGVAGAALTHAAAATIDAELQAARDQIAELRAGREAWRADVAGARDDLISEVSVYAEDPTDVGAQADLMRAIDVFRTTIDDARAAYMTAVDSFIAARREAAESAAADAQERFDELREEMEAIREDRFSEFCSRYESTGEVPAGYGAATDVAGGSGEMLVSTRCDVDSGDYTVELGDGAETTYVYETGYRWDPESESWEALEFESLDEEKVGDWIPREAFVDVPAEPESMGEPQFIAGYTCQLINDEWKCGCQDAACEEPRWQLQSTVPTIENQEISESVVQLRERSTSESRSSDSATDDIAP